MAQKHLTTQKLNIWRIAGEKIDCKRIVWHLAIKDGMVSFGQPADKKQHFDNSKLHKTKSQNKKGQPKQGKGVDIDNGGKY